MRSIRTMYMPVQNRMRLRPVMLTSLSLVVLQRRKPQILAMPWSERLSRQRRCRQIDVARINAHITYNIDIVVGCVHAQHAAAYPLASIPYRASFLLMSTWIGGWFGRLMPLLLWSRICTARCRSAKLCIRRQKMSLSQLCQAYRCRHDTNY